MKDIHESEPASRRPPCRTSGAVTRRLVTVDLRLIEASGIGTYLQHLVPQVMARMPDVRFCFLGTPEELSSHGWTGSRSAEIRPCAARPYGPGEQAALYRAIPSETDLYWAPHINLPLLYRGPMVVTVHDAFYAGARGGRVRWDKRAYASLLMRAVTSRPQAILCPSLFTARELARWRAPSGRIHVIHNGLDDHWLDVTPELPAPHPYPYVLCVGNVKAHKNLGRLVKAFARLVDELPHDLVVAGRCDAWDGAKLQATARRHLGSRVRFTGAVPRALLEQLYAHADAFAMPSLYEGFGLPPLEAMAAGVPCLVSSAAALPEVCGDAALYCEPHSIEDIATSLRRLLSDMTLRSILCSRGRKRVRELSWGETARCTAEVLTSVVATACSRA